MASIDDELIVSLNDHRRRLEKLFDQISFEDVHASDDLNTYREWLLEVVASSRTLSQGLTTKFFEEILIAKEKDERHEQLQEELARLEEENEELKSIIGVGIDDDEDMHEDFQMTRMVEFEHAREQRCHSLAAQKHLMHMRTSTRSFVGAHQSLLLPQETDQELHERCASLEQKLEEEQ